MPSGWRRTPFTDTAGTVEIAPDDWILLDPSGEPLARLYKVFGGTRGAGSLRGALTGNDARTRFGTGLGRTGQLSLASATAVAGRSDQQAARQGPSGRRAGR